MTEPVLLQMTLLVGQTGTTLQDEPTRGYPVWHYSLHPCMPACVCARVRMSERSFSICVMHLALKRVVICKSPLPWASGVKLGKAERKEGGRDRKTETDTGSMWMAGMSVKEGGQWVWEWFLLHNWLLSRVEQLWRTYMTAHHVWSRIHLRMINVP